MKKMTTDSIMAYKKSLIRDEKSKATIEKYIHTLLILLAWLPNGAFDKETLLVWKQAFAAKHAASTVNTMVAAVNSYLEFCGYTDCKIKPMKVQRRIFRERERELTKAEYLRLVEAAKEEGNERLQLILETLGSTGIRISELRFITVQAVMNGQATVNCKGKCRPVLLSKTLRRVLKEYCRRKEITCGPVFITTEGNPVDRSNIWKEMKRLCKAAKVDARKVFPHNLRHLFAVLYYKVTKDIAKLADLLGHASISTTRIYLMETGLSHQKQLDRLALFI